jgi:hypothetical protein
LGPQNARLADINQTSRPRASVAKTRTPAFLSAKNNGLKIFTHHNGQVKNTSSRRPHNLRVKHINTGLGDNHCIRTCGIGRSNDISYVPWIPNLV